MEYEQIMEYCADASNITSFQDFIYCVYSRAKAEYMFHQSFSSINQDEFTKICKGLDLTDKCLEEKSEEFSDRLNSLLEPTLSEEVDAEGFSTYSLADKLAYINSQLKNIEKRSNCTGFHLKNAYSCFRQLPRCTTNEDIEVLSIIKDKVEDLKSA
jgi:hypothetical protein